MNHDNAFTLKIIKPTLLTVRNVQNGLFCILFLIILNIHIFLSFSSSQPLSLIFTPFQHFVLPTKSSIFTVFVFLFIFWSPICESSYHMLYMFLQNRSYFLFTAFSSLAFHFKLVSFLDSLIWILGYEVITVFVAQDDLELVSLCVITHLCCLNDNSLCYFLRFLFVKDEWVEVNCQAGLSGINAGPEEAEAVESSSIWGQFGLQSEFKASVGDLVRSCQNKIRKEGMDRYCLMCEELELGPEECEGKEVDY